MQVKKQQLEPDMEPWTGSKLGKEYPKAVPCHPACLTYMQSTSCEMPGWMKLKLESWPKDERADKTKEGLGMQEQKNQTPIILPSPMM